MKITYEGTTYEVEYEVYEDVVTLTEIYREGLDVFDKLTDDEVEDIRNIVDDYLFNPTTNTPKISDYERAVISLAEANKKNMDGLIGRLLEEMKASDERHINASKNSLRDMFASAAMNGLIINQDVIDRELGYVGEETIVMNAYVLADAMLKERKR